MSLQISPAVEADADALVELGRRSEDGGAVAFAPEPQVSPTEALAARGHGALTLVAKRHDRVVGAAQLSTSRVTHRSGQLTLAWLSGLQVDPDARRQGVARALTEARLDLVAPDAVVGAAIQAGNEASRRNAYHWASCELGTLRVTPVPRSRPRPRRGREALGEPARAADLEQVAELLRDFADRHVLGPSPDARDLADWLGVQVRGRPLNSYVVARSGSRVVAGLGLEQQGLVSTLRVVRMPLGIRVANTVLRVIPRDGLMSNLNVRLACFAPGHEREMRALLELVRGDDRDRGTHVVVASDPTGPLARALRLPRWLPSVDLAVLIREPRDAQLARLQAGLPVGVTP